MVLGCGSHSRSQVSVAINGSIVLVIFNGATGPPTGWSKSLGSVPSSWHSVSDNYIVKVAGSIPTIGDFHTVGPCKKAVFACLATDVK